ncbi:MAG: hypothetical protein Q9218_004047 [Villophora microphyllina]
MTIGKDLTNSPPSPLINISSQAKNKMPPPPPKVETTPDQRHAELVNEYMFIKTVHPTVTALQRSPVEYRMLEDAMSHQYKLLLRRSQNLADYEITVFEAAFISLMQEGKAHRGALSLFVEELLGLKMIAQHEKVEVLKAAVKVRTLFLTPTRSIHPQAQQAYPTPPKERLMAYDYYGDTRHTVMESIHASVAHPNPSIAVPDVSRSLIAEEETGLLNTHELQRHARKRVAPPSAYSDRQLGFDGNTDLDSAIHMDDPHLTKLIALYHDAKKEFDEADPASEAYLETTKFLRATAENCVQYLSSISADDARLEELRQTFAEASAIMVQKMGDLKRRFEYEWKGTPRRPSVPTPVSRREKERVRRREKWTYEGSGRGDGLRKE